MSKPVLKILLQRRTCDIKEDIVKKIIVHLGLGHSFVSCSTKEYVFIPFFVERPMPTEVLSMMSKIRSCTTDQLAFELNITGNVPRVYFNHIIVSILDILQPTSSTQERITWKDGFLANLGRCKLFFIHKNINLIQCVISSRPKDLPIIWKYLRIIANKSRQLRDELLPGLINALLLKCLHCVIRKALQIQQEVHEWDLEYLLDIPTNEYRDVCVCKLTKEEIPGAFVHPVDNESDFSKTLIAGAEKHLQTVFQNQVPKVSAKQDWYLRAQRIMHVEPVIDELVENDGISFVQKSQLDLENDDSKITYLLDKLVIEGDDMSTQKLKAALQNTGYHTNVILAQLIGDETNQTSEQYSDLLTDEEMIQVKTKFYKAFITDVSADDIMPYLIASAALDDCMQEEVHAKPTRRKKAYFLLDNILLRGTYQTMQHFREALVETHQLHLAELLPLR